MSHDAHHDEHSIVAHHFISIEQQRDSATLGMWAFLVTEVMFFGTIFGVYFLYRLLYPEAWAAGSQYMSIPLGTLNTAILLTSSLTMSLAVHSAEVDNPKSVKNLLWLTLLLATAFLGIKGIEYAHKFQEHIVPGMHFVFEGPGAGHVELFFYLYFVMTGIHAFHMVIGMVWMLIYIYLAGKGRFSKGRYIPMHLLGMYWCFVDVVWIFLFPLFYFIGRHG